MNVLSLEHRYSDISIHFGDIQPPDRTVNPAHGAVGFYSELYGHQPPAAGCTAV